jgi:hypothetical protein
MNARRASQLVRHFVEGPDKGNIKEVDAAGKAMRIEWDNGVIFFR